MRAVMVALCCIVVVGLAVATRVDRWSLRFQPPARPLQSQPPRGGPELMRWHFERSHYPYPAVLDRAMADQMLADMLALPSEDEVSGGGDRVAAVNSWQSIGPWTMPNSGGGRITGRIRDVESDAALRIAAASGGVWQHMGFFSINLTHNLPTQWVQTFATRPGVSNTILVGTGEFSIRTGNGLWKTIDNGGTWTRKTLSPEPPNIFRIRYLPDGSAVLAATSTGCFRSTNHGETWTRTFTGPATDLGFLNSSTIYMPSYNDGLHVSTNGGLTWSKMTTGGIPTSGTMRGTVAVGSVLGVTFIYVAFDTGLWRSSNGGASWTNVTPVDGFYNPDDYVNAITCNFGNPQQVVAGAVGLFRSNNSGNSWTRIVVSDHHADQHALRSAAGALWSGHDGGLSQSEDFGLTWETDPYNYFPITQYYNLAVGVSNPDVIVGGTQDNSLTITTDGGATWRVRREADGYGVAVDPFVSSRMWGVDGPDWDRYRSTDHGATWTSWSVGIDTPQLQGEIRTDRIAPATTYTCSGAHVYRLLSGAPSWTKMNASPFPAICFFLGVTSDPAKNPVLYACLNSTTSGQRLRVYDAGWWERSTGLPAGNVVLRVVPHPSPSRSSTAWALIAGLGSPGAKIFKTDNRGQTWVNITGNLPNLPLWALAPHPTDDNQLYLGTELGCLRTMDGGQHWYRWENGLPQGALITELDAIDRRTTTGEYFIVAATFGRSMWKREISGQDPVGVADAQQRGTLAPSIRPNPFRGAARIEFVLPAADRVAVDVIDVRGRVVARPFEGRLGPGRHGFDFDGRSLPSGVYYCRLQTSNGTVARAMTLRR